MIVDLGTPESAFLPFDFTLQPEEVDLEGETEELKSAIHVKGELKKGIAQTDVSGAISARISVECTRCLAKVEQDLNFPFEASFVFPENYTEEREAELHDADLDISIIESDKI